MTKEQKSWADLVVNGMAEIQAYQQVYPKASKKTAQNQLGTFRHDVGIQTYIKAKADKLSRKIDEKVSRKLANKKVVQLLTTEKKRAILAQIVSGKYNGIKATLNDIQKALEIDNRMTGDLVLAKRHEIQKAQEIQKVIVVEDQTIPKDADRDDDK